MARHAARAVPGAHEPDRRRQEAAPARRGPDDGGIAAELSGSRGHLGGECDLPCDLDDVAVRVEDAELTLGAVPSSQQLAHAFELPLGSELLRVRLDLAEGPPDDLRYRD